MCALEYSISIRVFSPIIKLCKLSELQYSRTALLNTLFFAGIRQCRGKKVRQYHRSTQRSKAAFGSTTNCQSRRVLTNLVCNASCPRRRSQSPRVAFLQLDAAASSCCRPIRTVQKKIRMVCDDGTEMRQVIHRVRRCGCQPCT